MPEEMVSAEMPEVAEPVEEETGAEDQEVAAPESEEHQKTEADASFAEMRRQMQEAQREADDARAELAEMQAQNEARQAAYSRLTGKGDDAFIEMLAEQTGLSEDEVRAEMDAVQESVQKDFTIQQLQERISAIEGEKLAQEDLERLRKIDPSLKSISDLGPEFFYYRFDDDGNEILDAEHAYYAVEAKKMKNRKVPPKPPGKVATGTAEKDRYTEAEIDAMSPEQRRVNWKQIFNSWG